MLAGLFILIMIIVSLLVTAPSRPLSLIIFVAATSTTATLLVGRLSTILALLLFAPLILSFLLLCK